MKRPFFLLLLGCGFLHAEVEIVPQPDFNCLPGKTTVWTAAMQAAFDRLLGAQNSMKLDRVEPPNQLVAKMAGFSWKEDAVLPKDGWFAVTGDASEKLVDEANQKWTLLGEAGRTPFKFSGASGGRAAYVGMKRAFVFRNAFSPSAASRLRWGPDRVPVRFFGVRGEAAGDYAGSVRILAHRPSEQMMALQFLAAHGDDTLVLYQPAVGQPMIEAMRWVTAWQKQWKERKGNGMDWDDKNLHRTDELRIPEISLSAYDDFSDEFKGTLWFKSSKQPQQISQAATEVMLKVDGAGVKFTASETYQGVDPFAVQTVDPVPRRFWFDRPFFAFLWRDGAEWPHAAVWFGSSEGLGHL